MIKILRFVFIPALALSFVLLLSSWGYQGHRKINSPVTAILPASMDFLKASWAIYLPDHGSDADYRKSSDPTESPKHYIDIDNYPVFVQTGKIPMSWDSVVNMYGYDFVIDNGILPWATRAAYDSVKACFERKNWDRAAMFAADLGHYVGDGHMPLHITKNYNGQFTGQTGVHSRYETKMINAYIGQVIYQNTQAQKVNDINGYIFTYLYDNYAFADSVLYSDSLAIAQTGSTISAAYLAAFWQYSGNYTTALFRNASQVLANLIYTAWVEAGSPVPQGITEEPFASLQFDAFPNPGKDSINISFEITTTGTSVTLYIIDSDGKIIDTLLENKEFNQGKQAVKWNSSEKEPGIYFAMISSNGLFSVVKILKLG